MRRGARRAQPAERGIYLWGGVGRGKTFLMDLFHSQLRVPGQRHHFHRFMKQVHGRLALLRDVEDPLACVAAEIAREHRVLCLDELFVSDIADAMILGGLFAALDARGVTLVFTSNAAPTDLYRDGLQRSRFLPAIALLERCTEIVNVDAGTDYRLRQLEKAPLYLDSGDPFAESSLALRFEEILESLAVGQDWDNDVRVVLFVRLRPGVELDAALEKKIRDTIRANTTPRHVPARIVAVPDIPRTISGKIVELAVRNVIHGRPVRNTDALANPQALEHFRDRPELAR
jgi:predicted ATPase